MAYFTASCDQVELNTKYAAELKLDYPILSDPDAKAATAYGVVNATRKFPQRWTFFIDIDGNISYIDKKVSVTTHGADIAKKLESLGVKKK